MLLQRKFVRLLIVLLSFTLLTGCWDQKLLKDLKLVFIIGLDKGEDGQIISNVAIRESKTLSVGGKPGEASVAVVEGIGTTISDTRLSLDRKIPGQFSPSKMRVCLIGEELATEDLYSLLDILYRDPAAPLGAKLAIVEGTAGEIINMRSIKETLLTEAISDLLITSEEDTLAVNETVQTVCPIMFDPTGDFSLPVLKKTETKDVELTGVALFNDKVYTGVKLDAEQSTLLILLMGKKGKQAQLNIVVHPEEQNFQNRHLMIGIKDVKRKVKSVVRSSTDIKIDMDLNLTAYVMEYPKDGLISKKKVKELEKKVSQTIEEKVVEVVGIIQEANSDVLRTGQEVKIHHYDVWKKINWKEVYPNIEINPTVTVDIKGTGIIN
ncbi:Ger(x)C family spore germination protein [Sutcliffiella rhizosphaerae]|uniref:Spore germination protein A3 n=1 Tax=Sutcliffiella rhizosphaerae TaxID=2880967 RepID=A0ABM8YKS0_9BACI|nr:Ger(x)C family spore germination protein [Sutcliffiella rhizosphaerae]CAG9620518.1 Spore germination protein A3 [Sutcliffiella rhizosphaerae]